MTAGRCSHPQVRKTGRECSPTVAVVLGRLQPVHCARWKVSGDKHPPSLSPDLLAELPHTGRKPRGAAHTGSLPDEERGGGGWRSNPGIQEWGRVLGAGTLRLVKHKGLSLLWQWTQSVLCRALSHCFLFQPDQVFCKVNRAGGISPIGQMGKLR